MYIYPYHPPETQGVIIIIIISPKKSNPTARVALNQFPPNCRCCLPLLLIRLIYYYYYAFNYNSLEPPTLALRVLLFRCTVSVDLLLLNLDTLTKFLVVVCLLEDSIWLTAKQCESVTRLNCNQTGHYAL